MPSCRKAQREAPTRMECLLRALNQCECPRCLTRAALKSRVRRAGLKTKHRTRYCQMLQKHIAYTGQEQQNQKIFATSKKDKRRYLAIKHRRTSRAWCSTSVVWLSTTCGTCFCRAGALLPKLAEVKDPFPQANSSKAPRLSPQLWSRRRDSRKWSITRQFGLAAPEISSHFVSFLHALDMSTWPG